MPAANELKDLALRMARAFEELGAFVFQRDLDAPGEVMKLIRQLELSHLLNVTGLQHGIYVVTLNTRPCSVECKLKRCAELHENERDGCLSSCVASCKRELLKRVVEVLMSYARAR